MIIIANNDEEEASAWAALEVIQSLRARNVLPIRPDVTDTRYVKTHWPHDWYL